MGGTSEGALTVVLVGSTPAEHALGAGTAEGLRDFAEGSFNYAIGLLAAVVETRLAPEERPRVVLRHVPVARGQRVLPEEELRAILELRPNVVGFSCYCWDLHLFLASAYRLARLAPGLEVVLGGPSASFRAERIVRSCPYVRAVVRGEGEAAFLALCRGRFRDLDRIPGLTFRRPDGSVVATPDPDRPEDLRALPSPYLTGTLAPRPGGSVLLEQSRGCRYRCSFCSWSTRRGPVRDAGADKLAAEVRWAVERGSRAINFCDTAVNHDTARLRELCRVLAREDPERRLSLSAFLRHEALDEEQLEVLATVPFSELIIGVESTSPEALRACGKPPVDLALLETRLAALGRAGHRVTLSFMSGLPGDSVDGFRRTLDDLEGLAGRLPEAVNRLCGFWLAVLPGTRLASRSREHRFTTLAHGTPYVTSSRDFSPEDLVEMARLLVERVDRSARLRCEEVHRAAATGAWDPASEVARRPRRSGPSALRTALVHAPPHGEVPFRHIGLAYLQAALERGGVETSFLDVSLEEDEAGTDFYEEHILHLSRGIGDMGDGPDPRLLLEVSRPERFAELSPLAETIVEKAEARLPAVLAAGEVCLLSANALTLYFAAALGALLRREGAPVAMGGPALHHAPLRRLLLLAGIADAAAEGEGDSIAVGLVRWLAAGRRGEAPPGLSCLDEQGRIRAIPAGDPPVLDALPDPSFRGTRIADFVPALTSRGCPRRCAFCSEPELWSAARGRDPRLVVDELERAVRATGIRSIHFHDDAINGDLRRLDRLTALLVERRLDLSWESFCCPEGLTAARLARMRESGCVLLKVGVQSFAPEVLRAMRRAPRPGPVVDALVEASRLGISVRYDMLVGFPGETEEDHRRNLEAIEALFAECPGISFSPNPFYLAVGSETARRPGRYGLTLRDFDPATLPRPLDGLVRAAGSFPCGYASAIPTEVLRRRMDELGALLARHDQDYLYLGQRRAPPRKASRDCPPIRG